MGEDARRRRGDRFVFPRVSPLKIDLSPFPLASLKRPKILVFDEVTSDLDGPTAEQFAESINSLKGKVTIMFITHHVPKKLRVDDGVILREDKRTELP